MSDKVEIDLDDFDELKDVLNEKKEASNLDFKKIFTHFVLNWQWYLLSVVICLCGAIFYLKYARPAYELTARMLVKDDQKKSNNSVKQMLPNMQDFGFMNNSSGFDNEVEILASPVTVHDAVKRLKLYTEYRLDGHFTQKLVYPHPPVCVDLDPVSLDSLDYYMLAGSRTIQLAVTKKRQGYHVDIELFEKGKRRKEYAKDIATLPVSLKTDFGTLSIVGNPTYTIKKDDPFQKGKALVVTIRPPMSVALGYMKRLEVEPTSKKTTIADITLKDENAIRGIDFLNALVLCYNEQANDDKNELALKTEEFINQRLEKIDAELGTTENSLEDYKRRNSVTHIEADAAQSLQLSAQLAARLADANTQLQILDYLEEYMDDPNNRHKLVPANIGLDDQASTLLITDYNRAVLDRARLMRSSSEQSPQVLTLTATLENLETTIRQAFAQARHSLELERSSIQGQYAKYQGRIANTPEHERVLTQIGRQQEVRSGIYLLLLQKREENSISLAATADKGKLIAPPLSNGKVSPRTTLVLAAALLLGLFIAFVILMARQLLRYRIEGREDIASLTKIPVLADIPVANENAKSTAGIVVHADTNNQIDEVFRLLRTNIQFMMKEHDQVILFTSSTSGEGKTFLAANLAMSFALLGKKVVLCGLDIRKPALGHLFGLKDRLTGISLLLAKDELPESDLLANLFPSGVNENLDLLLAGPTPPNPTELLARESLHEIIEMLKRRYDYVIFDTAPVGLVTDTLQIARYADVNCYVCRADYTPKANIGLLNTLAEDKKLKNVCLILNGVDMSKRKYGYYYGYGRYGKYGRYGNNGAYGNYGSYGNYAASHYGNKEDDSIKK